MKNKIYSPFLILSCCFFSANAQTNIYSLATVPEVLKNNAAVIMQKEDINLEIENLEKASLNVHEIFTVMNEDGQAALLFNEYSTKYRSLDDAEMRVYDQNGKQVNKFKKKDMTTVAVGEGLVEDGYMTYYRVKPMSYPVTVEVTYEQKLKSTLSIPDFRFIAAKEAVVESNYTATVPTEIGLRYKAVHSSITPMVTAEGKNTVYKWSVKNLPAMDDEEGSVSARNRFPYVNIVTNQFSHYGFQGDLSTWKSFGAWINDLYKGLDELPDAQQQFLQHLVSDAPNETEKIRRIYQTHRSAAG